ncbi:hypothetical protein LH464_17420 [Neorhizobium sp. T786]|uniref:hypothetical protein n=1 Tax=Pseudorhizobium xiangyangii TaxID=2883104 RepID=UPI001D001996|nr:hypothetical protein [Neorhizobium xiangyangii]MCB5204249.1 hypothetical protein [Neorhizobium xiangyangii]
MTTSKTTTKPEANNTPATKTVKMPVILVTSPGGPRRRAGFSFSEATREFREADLEGKNVEELIEAWRADPKLKVDMKTEEVPATEGDDE